MRDPKQSDTPLHRGVYTACVPYKDTGRYLLHSFMTGKFALLTEGQKEVFEHPAEHPSAPVLPELIRLGFVTDGDDYAALTDKLKNAYPRLPQGKGLTLEICPTMGCNFDCRYCFEAGRRRPGTMSAETAGQVAEFARKRMEETHATRLSVTWFGGEPTLAPETISRLSDRLIAVAEEHGVPYGAYIQTNGYLLTQEMADMLEQKRVETVEITVDGSRATHDKLRVLSGGHGTYDRIMENLFRLRTGMQVKIRCNLHRDNLAAFADLMQDVERMKAVTGNDIICTPRIIRAEKNLPEEGAFLRDTVLQNDEYLRKFHELYAMNHFDSPSYQDVAYFRGRATSPCKACSGTGFTIDERGNIYACSMDVGDPGRVIGSVGSYENDASLDDGKGYAFYRDSVCTDRERCKACEILPVCLGRCPRTWDKFYDCERLKGNLADTMVRVYDLLQKEQNRDL